MVAGRNAVKDGIAGLVACVVLIANIVSFGALMFPGQLGQGIPVAIWAMLVGSSIGGVCIALVTSLPPLATGIDSPTGAFLVLLSAAAGSSVLAAGGSADSAVTTVMLIFTAATVVSGIVLLVVGACRWGTYFRFVPYFVVGGFLAATGWFLLAGGVRMTTGMSLSAHMLDGSWSAMGLAKLGSALAVLLVLLGVRRWTRSALAMPVALVTMWVVAVTTLRLTGLSSTSLGWYLPSLGKLAPWLPFAAMRSAHMSWPMILGLMPEFLAVTIVALVSLVTKVSSVEVARQAAGSLDREFLGHGMANVLAAPFGGIACSLQTGTSRLLEQAGGATRASGAVAALALGAVAVLHVDLPGIVPIPIVAGIVFYLGYTFVVDALARPYAQRAWVDLLLALAIMVVCVRYGYLVGVLAGLVGACVLFALNYARLGAVRRHASRAAFASNVDRSAEASQRLRDLGDTVQIYWLSGYVFFGSSEGVVERVRADIEALPRRRVAYVILDFANVAGADSSAIASLTKLRNYCNRHDIVLVYSGLPAINQAAMQRAGFFGGRSRHRAFPDLNAGLAWCEDQVLAHSGTSVAEGLAGFEAWLQGQLGSGTKVAELMSYLERKETTGAQVLYREGEPANCIDLVAAGTLTVDVAGNDGRSVRVRRIMTHTVLGEMGFVRHAARSATVSTEGPATVYSMSRANFERMRRERPDLASAFDDFILRILADRVDAANRAAVALGG